jgi:hypothetical protein
MLNKNETKFISQMCNIAQTFWKGGRHSVHVMSRCHDIEYNDTKPNESLFVYPSVVTVLITDTKQIDCLYLGYLASLLIILSIIL